MNGCDIADQGDEVDVELLGGDPAHWQTNVYAPSPRDKGPLWGVFGEIEDYPTGSVKQNHEYTVDWNAERIVWSVDGQTVRTVTKGKSCVLCPGAAMRDDGRGWLPRLLVRVGRRHHEEWRIALPVAPYAHLPRYLGR